MTIYFVLAGIVICVYLSSFFSGSEMSYSSCSRMRLESEMEEGSKKARSALYIVDHFDDALGAILIGNNLVNIACSSLGSVAVILITGTDRYAWVATVILTIAVIIFGETIPKITAKKGANNYAKKYAFIIRFLMIVLKPLVLIFVGLIALITAPMKGELIEDDSDGKVEELLIKDRVDFIYPADYSENTGLDKTVKNIIRKIAVCDVLESENAAQLKQLRS